MFVLLINKKLIDFALGKNQYLILYKILLAITSTQHMITSTTYSSLTSQFLVRIKSKIDSTNLQTESPTTNFIIDQTSIYIESILTTTEQNFLSYSSSTLKTTTSSNATILAVILVCSFSGFLFLALIFTFLLR